MKTIYTYIFLTFTIITYAQPKIEFETTEYDFGQFVTAGTIKKDFTIKNIGDEPLIITRARTGDGGSYATYPREPILPDSTGIITFYYNSKRIGPFRKRIILQSNAENSYGKGISIKGEVIYRSTEIEVNQDTIDIGKIPFGTIKETTFEIKNVGQERLFINTIIGKYYESDLFYQKIRHLSLDDDKTNHIPYEPNEVASVTIALRNIHGDVGDFHRTILLKYNSYDTVAIVVKGQYIGKSPQKTVYEERAIYQYENGQLTTKTKLNYEGEAQLVSYFEGAYCTNTQYISWQNGNVNIERFFKFGELVGEKKYGD